MNHLIIWKDAVLFWGTNPRAITKHGHPVIQWVVGEKQAFRTQQSDGQWVEKRAMLIAPNHAHACDARNLQIITLGIDPESSLGEWIMKNVLKEDNTLDFPERDIKPEDFEKLNNWLEAGNWSAMRAWIEDVFGYNSEKHIGRETDERLQAVIEFIANHIEGEINTAMLTEVAHLSESRLLHLFKEHMGLPIRNYIQWYRLQLALKFVISGKSLTEAAYHAGFADQAHMTRTCVKMVGIPPSTAVKNSKFVQVSIPD